VPFLHTLPFVPLLPVSFLPVPFLPVPCYLTPIKLIINNVNMSHTLSVIIIKFILAAIGIYPIFKINDKVLISLSLIIISIIIL